MSSDQFGRKWLIENAKDILTTYSSGITLRQLYYRLVARGMTNDLKHYKNLVAAMEKARWAGVVDWDAFIDRERSMYGDTRADEKDVDYEIEAAKEQIKRWMEAYYLERWSNQPYFVEVWIEKKALQGVFESPCLGNGVGLAPCKGYPSLTFLKDAKERFLNAMANDKNVVILYFGDYDPSGANIPVSIQENLARMGADVIVKRIALNPELIAELGLVGVPPKVSDSRTRNWDGTSAVELDAVEPKLLSQMCRDAISEFFDSSLYDELKEREQGEREKYQSELKKFVNELKED